MARKMLILLKPLRIKGTCHFRASCCKIVCLCTVKNRKENVTLLPEAKIECCRGDEKKNMDLVKIECFDVLSHAVRNIIMLNRLAKQNEKQSKLEHTQNSL